MEQAHNLTLKQKLARIFDDDLKTWQWKNVADWVIIGLIVISTVEVFLSTFNGINERYSAWLTAIDLFTTAFFTVEVSLRIWCADLIDPKYKGFWGRVRYCFSFYGFIDLISTYSFYVALLFPVPYSALKVLRVLRVLRVFRYMKSFQVLADAFRSKRQEFWISLQFLTLVTLILSFLLFFVEHQAQPEVYDNGWRSVVWAFAQYIGDPGGFADTPPITFWGRIIAVAVGVLGIAIFAVPAGLVSSGFVEVIEQRRKEDTIRENMDMIYSRFKVGHADKKLLLSDTNHERCAPMRYLSTGAIRSVCMLTDTEILEAVRTAPDLRLRPMKSDEEMRVSDMTVVERHLKEIVKDEDGKVLYDNPYGFRRWNDNESLVLLGPSGANEPGLSHIMATLAENTTFNMICRERRFYGAAKDPGLSVSPFYVDMKVTDGNVPFTQYVEALRGIRRGQRVVCIASGASGRADFEVQWGMPSGTEGYQFEGAHAAPEDREWVQQFCERLKANAAEITVTSAARKDLTFNFTFATHQKLCFGTIDKPDHIARAIYNHTGATVLMVYMNIKTVLKAPDERYYAAIKVLLDTLEKCAPAQ